jgi:anhydro-N-acetylmuramic acid kinase
MSGTSVDGLDIALCDVEVRARRLRNHVSQTFAYPDVLQSKLLTLARVGSVDLHELASLSIYLGHFYASSIEKFCNSHGVAASGIDLVGSHGQTIAHLSQPRTVLGSKYGGTLQIGEAEVVAKHLGVITVSDFRAGDIALGGSGAPLVPVYHQCRFAEGGALRVVVNIGGIANITVLNAIDGITATDTGPGNCLIDACMQAVYGRPFDASGTIAQSGQVDRQLLTQLRQDATLNRSLPTSHDRREMLELADRHHLLAAAVRISHENLIATVSELTVATIADAIIRIVDTATLDAVLVCGGGVLNDFLMSRLRNCLGNTRVESTTNFGSDPEFVEAEAFAYMANLTLDAEDGNVPAVTGASRQAVLGKISQP